MRRNHLKLILHPLLSININYRLKFNDLEFKPITFVPHNEVFSMNFVQF